MLFWLGFRNDSTPSRGPLSQKQAEYFLARQVSFLNQGTVLNYINAFWFKLSDLILNPTQMNQTQRASNLDVLFTFFENLFSAGISSEE